MREFILLCFCFYSLDSSHAANTKEVGFEQVCETRVAKSGSTKLVCGKGNIVWIVLETSVFKKATGRKANRSETSSNVRVSIKVDGVSVFVPKSVYSDLSEVDEARLSVRKGTGVLNLARGDTSESTTTMITFDQERVLERFVFGANQSELLEHTNYYSVILP